MGEEKAPQIAVERIEELKNTNEIKLWKISEGIVHTFFNKPDLNMLLNQFYLQLLSLRYELGIKLVGIA